MSEAGYGVSADNAESIRTLLAQQIASGSLQPGHRLLAERELGRRFGAGRHTVRKALESLEADGLIVRTVGRGTFVTGAVRGPGSLAESSPRDILEARLLLEPEVIRLAALNATRADLHAMETCLKRSEAARAHEEFERWDSALHQAIVRATHNSALEQMFEAIQAARQDVHWGKLKRSTDTAENRAAYREQHGGIVAALHERDGELAGERMREHLRTVRFNMLGI